MHAAAILAAGQRCERTRVNAGKGISYKERLDRPVSAMQYSLPLPRTLFMPTRADYNPVVRPHPGVLKLIFAGDRVEEDIIQLQALFGGAEGYGAEPNCLNGVYTTEYHRARTFFLVNAFVFDGDQDGHYQEYWQDLSELHTRVGSNLGHTPLGTSTGGAWTSR